MQSRTFAKSQGRPAAEQSDDGATDVNKQNRCHFELLSIASANIRISRGAFGNWR
jgi:hypothetical protein